MMNSEAYRAHLYNRILKYNPKFQRQLARIIALRYLKQDNTGSISSRPISVKQDLLSIYNKKRVAKGLTIRPKDTCSHNLNAKILSGLLTGKNLEELTITDYGKLQANGFRRQQIQHGDKTLLGRLMSLLTCGSHVKIFTTGILIGFLSTTLALSMLGIIQ